MKKQLLLTATSAVFALALSSCSSKAVVIDFNNVPDNDNCRYMKEVCREAEKFQGQYQQMSKEEKEDAKVILNAYIQQCEGAQELCKRSVDR